VTPMPQAQRSGSALLGAQEPGFSIRPNWMSADEAGQQRWPDQMLSVDQAWPMRTGSRALLFGRFRFVLHSRELTADGAPVPLGGRALEVLSVLIEARGELVTKDELLDRVWPTTTVEENNLQFQISSLRKALGEDREFIKTVSGRGYRLAAEMMVESGSQAPDARTAGPVRHDAPAYAPNHWPVSNNLPARTSDIVGREAHLSDVAALVEANRLVTLVGAGGIGKTRMAIELAHRLSSGFDDGVWIADLALLSDAGRVHAAVASMLGLDDSCASPVRLAAALGSRRPLLVFDNCEHVIEAVASLAETLLHAGPRVQVIATSREPLRAEGEWVYRVPPLDIPPEDADGLEDVLQYSAAKLLIERTRAAETELRLDARAAAAAALICRRLDGIPLALELAAARAASLGMEGLAARLDDRLSLLTEGRRTALARHQTLRAALDWSYELLSEPERVVMRRLAVFVGDFTLEDAYRVVGVGEVDPADVVKFLASLVAKSLVAADVGGPISRYRLLETMRAYAMDKLTASGEYGAIASRYGGGHSDQAATRAAGGVQAFALAAAEPANAA
jgi:predicted ATPase/DNA-binding winged helix-turn-helix (wHTH) protein